MVGTIGLINQIDDFGPKVGDIVSFDPLDPMSRDMHARLPAMPVNEQAGRRLRPGRADHARQRRQRDRRVRETRGPASATGCTGPERTAATDGADCGASADLLVNLDDIEVLAMAAGGYGVLRPASMSPLLLGSANAAAQ